MAVNQPPIQEVTTAPNGRFPQVWIRWFLALTRQIDEISNGYGADGIIDGGRRLTGESLFDGGRRI